jgi:hypothetical protein
LHFFMYFGSLIVVADISAAARRLAPSAQCGRRIVSAASAHFLGAGRQDGGSAAPLDGARAAAAGTGADAWRARVAAAARRRGRRAGRAVCSAAAVLRAAASAALWRGRRRGAASACSVLPGAASACVCAATGTGRPPATRRAAAAAARLSGRAAGGRQGEDGRSLGRRRLARVHQGECG